LAIQAAYDSSIEFLDQDPEHYHACSVSMENAEHPAFLAAWDTLSQHASEPNAFYESWFLLPAMRNLDGGAKVQLFTLWQGTPFQSPLIGLMPLLNEASYAGYPVTHCQNWLHHNAFLGSPLVRSGLEENFWQQLFRVMDDQPTSAVFLHLNGLVIGGPLQIALQKECSKTGRQYAQVHSKARAFLDGGLSADAYFENSVRGKKRKELRRQKARLAEQGDMQFSRINDACGIDGWIDEFLNLETQGWKGKNSSALNCEPGTRDFFREALHAAAEHGRLERLELRLDNQPLAMLVNFLCAPGSFSFKTTFDENYSRFSPGVLLQIENLDLLNREGIDWCDSCAAEGHPMIDSLWHGRRHIGRYSVAIGGAGRRMVFSLLLQAELAKKGWRNRMQGKNKGIVQGQIA
jgi:hypothetical protein